MTLRPLLIVLSLLCGAFSSLVHAEDYKSPLAKLELEDGDSLVFLGDSITHQVLYTQYVEDYFYTRFPDRKIRFHNAGVSGARAWDALQRFDRDVAAYKPKYVTVLLGMNDGGYQAFDQQTWETYRKDMGTVVERIRESGATPILMTPTMYDARAARMRRMDELPDGLRQYNSVLAYYGEWLREVATVDGLGFVDLHGPLNNLTTEQRETDPQFTMIKDAVHPDPPGQLVMAASMIEQLGLPRQVSSIRIGKVPDGTPAGEADGGELSDLGVNEEGMSFTFLAKSLPWVVPADAASGAKLLRLGHRLGRELLQVRDLPAGSYELTIDDEPVGHYSATELAVGIELQDNTKTPQYGQAMLVANLNQQRNNGPVRSLRNAWSQFQQWARLKAQLESMTGERNEQVAAQVADLGGKLEDLDQRVSALNDEAVKMEEKIREAAQPQPRKYHLHPARSADVSGTITLDGLPLTKGTITFFGEDGPIATGDVTQGSYIGHASGQAGIPPGSYTVTVEADGVPAKYTDATKSGLTVKVRPGKNSFDFALTK